MLVARQWREIEGTLPEGWSEARLLLSLDRSDLDRAAALLGPLNPGRATGSLRFTSVRQGGAAGPEAVRRLLRRLDREGVHGELELLRADEAEVVERAGDPTLAAGWEAALATLPSDWSDLYVEVGLRSSDHLPRAALLMAPLNPARVPDRLAFRFRAARLAGYGAAPQMVQRCLERCDEERIRGELSVLRVLSDTRHVATQGPVWYVGGKPV